MNANALLAVAFVSMALTLRAQEKPAQAQFDTSTSRKILDWDDPKWWQLMGETRAKSPGVSLGKSDFVVSGPLVDTFRVAPRSWRERSLGEKILDLPIVSLFVPQPMPVSHGTGKYFAWGERDRPWATSAGRSLAPEGGLISISLGR
jgi:hypothetical protein